MHIFNIHIFCFGVRNSLLNMSKEGRKGERERERERRSGGGPLKGSTLIVITGGEDRKVSALTVPGRARSSFSKRYNGRKVELRQVKWVR
jgi:hypothetical protein